MMSVFMNQTKSFMISVDGFTKAVSGNAYYQQDYQALNRNQHKAAVVIIIM